MRGMSSDYSFVSSLFLVSGVWKDQKLNYHSAASSRLHHRVKSNTKFKDRNSFSPPVRHSFYGCDSLEDTEHTEETKK